MTPAECASKLKELFPALFGADKPLPLKLRIQADIQERAPGVFTKAVLSAFLRRYTGNHAYLVGLTKATQRFEILKRRFPGRPLVFDHPDWAC